MVLLLLCQEAVSKTSRKSDGIIKDEVRHVEEPHHKLTSIIRQVLAGKKEEKEREKKQRSEAR
jgi:hypothetical protein